MQRRLNPNLTHSGMRSAWFGAPAGYRLRRLCPRPEKYLGFCARAFMYRGTDIWNLGKVPGSGRRRSTVCLEEVDYKDSYATTRRMTGVVVKESVGSSPWTRRIMIMVVQTRAMRVDGRVRTNRGSAPSPGLFW